MIGMAEVLEHRWGTKRREACWCRGKAKGKLVKQEGHPYLELSRLLFRGVAHQAQVRVLHVVHGFWGRARRMLVRASPVGRGGERYERCPDF
jgi:ribosomal protein S14